MKETRNETEKQPANEEKKPRKNLWNTNDVILNVFSVIGNPRTIIIKWNCVYLQSTICLFSFAFYVCLSNADISCRIQNKKGDRKQEQKIIDLRECEATKEREAQNHNKLHIRLLNNTKIIQ